MRLVRLAKIQQKLKLGELAEHVEDNLGINPSILKLLKPLDLGNSCACSDMHFLAKSRKSSLSKRQTQYLKRCLHFQDMSRRFWAICGAVLEMISYTGSFHLEIIERSSPPTNIWMGLCLEKSKCSVLGQLLSPAMRLVRLASAEA